MKQSERWAAAEAALEEPFSLEGATVVHEPRPARVVFSARIPAELSPEIADLATAAGITPSAMIARLVEEALHARRLAATETVTVNRAELHRLVDQALGAAPAGAPAASGEGAVAA